MRLVRSKESSPYWLTYQSKTYLWAVGGWCISQDGHQNYMFLKDIGLFDDTELTILNVIVSVIGGGEGDNSMLLWLNVTKV